MNSIRRTYALSDPHGHLAPLEQALQLVDLDGDTGASLVLLGDYINRGPDSLGVLKAVQRTVLAHPGRAVALLGNHEVAFLEWLADDEGHADGWLLEDPELLTLRSMLGEVELQAVISAHVTLETAGAALKQALRDRHGGLLRWLQHLSLVHETDHAIYVHAGVDELAGADWRAFTPDHFYTHKFPASTGLFVKTIVAGHVRAGTLRNSQTGHRAFFDGASHWYIDGSVETTGCLNLLLYNAVTGEFSSQVVSTSGD